MKTSSGAVIAMAFTLCVIVAPAAIARTGPISVVPGGYSYTSQCNDGSGGCNIGAGGGNGAAGSGEELLLSPFALSRVKKDEQGRPYTVPLYRAAITVTLNQTLVVGASKEEGSKNALILIILAQETTRPGTPGGKSVRK